MSRRCVECLDERHDDYDNKGKVVIVRNPETGQIIMRTYLCRTHREIYEARGYKVSPVNWPIG